MWPPPFAAVPRWCTACRCAGTPQSWRCDDVARVRTGHSMSPSLLSRRLPLAMPEVQHDTLGRLSLACDFHEAVTRTGQWPLKPERLEVLQINVGKLCNQTCRHCHVDAGPDRREVMTRETMTRCLDVLDKTDHSNRRHHGRRP